MQRSDRLLDDIRAVLHDRLHVVVESPEVDLLETGSVDSIGLVELVLELEERFEMSLPMDALDIDDFRSISSIADLITRLSRTPLGQDGRATQAKAS